MPKLRDDTIINPGGNSVNTSSTQALFYKDLREWGAITANTADKQPIIQQAINDCITNGYRKLYIPTIGQYHIQSPLIISSFYAGNYVGVSLEIFGDSSMWDAGFASFIKMDFSDAFGIGIQNGKGVTIRGLSFSGQFVSPIFSNDYSYYRSDFNTYTDGVSRDSKYSPNAAIVIDPFTRGSLPSDGGYPGLSAWYKGTGGQNGSTATTIDNCTIEKTVVGICSSPNGSTRNAEITSIRNVRFGTHKLCVAGGQDQEKTNSIYNSACWNGTHTFFATGKYGAGTAGHWDIERVNIAGRSVQFIDNDQQGNFPTNVKSIYAEGLGRLGFMQNNTSQGASVRDCIIGFAYPDTAGLQTLFSGDGIVYDKCTFRYYGHVGVPLQIAGESIFRDCTLSGYPLLAGQYWYPRFVDCRANGAFLGLTGTKTAGGGNKVHPYGDWTLDFYNTDSEVRSGNDRGFRSQVKSSTTEDIYTSIFSDNNVAVTVSGMTLAFTSANSSIYFGYGLIYVGSYTAVVTNISGNVVTASYVDPSMPSGTYNVTSYHPLFFNGSFLGDITSGQNTITNCKADYLSSNQGITNYVGLVIRNPYGGSKYIKIISVSGTTLTFYGSIATTKTGVIFGNYSHKTIYTEYPSNTPFPAGYLVRKGDEIVEQKGSENQVTHKITAGGFLSGDTDTRQATMTTIP